MFFELAEGSKCFSEVLEADQLVLGHYRAHGVQFLRASVESGLGGNGGDKDEFEFAMHIRVTSPRGVALVDAQGDDSKQFAFTAHESGEHSICFTRASKAYSEAPLEVEFALEFGDEAHLDDAMRAEHVSSVENLVRKLHAKVSNVRSEQMYLRQREERFFQTSVSTLGRATWWSIGQILAMILVTALQMAMLRFIFQEKKLI